jgi:hypothetical protein
VTTYEIATTSTKPGDAMFTVLTRKQFNAIRKLVMDAAGILGGLP